MGQGKSCSICDSDRLADVNLWLAEGHSAIGVARKFGFSRYQVMRHRSHRSEREAASLLAQAQAGMVAKVTDDLLANLEKRSEQALSEAASGDLLKKLHVLELELDRLSVEAARLEDVKAGVSAAAVKLRTVEMEARFRGMLNKPGVGTINQQVNFLGFADPVRELMRRLGCAEEPSEDEPQSAPNGGGTMSES